MLETGAEIEGTWEEIVAEHAGELTGRKVRLVVLPQVTEDAANGGAEPELALEKVDLEQLREQMQKLPPHERFAASHRIATQMESRMPLRPGCDTLAYIREARSGAMYDMDPVDD